MEITSYSNQEFKPKHFMTIYTNELNEHYLEVGDIDEKKNKYIYTESRPASREFLSELVKSIKTNDLQALRFKALIPSNVFWFHSENERPEIMWRVKSDFRELYFSEEIGIPSRKYILPDLLFHLKEETLSVYVLKLSSPVEEAELFELLLPNIYDDNSVCLGDNLIKLKRAETLEELMINYETLFFQTEFNALHRDIDLKEGELYTDFIINVDAIRVQHDKPIKKVKDLFR